MSLEDEMNALEDEMNALEERVALATARTIVGGLRYAMEIAREAGIPMSDDYEKGMLDAAKGIEETYERATAPQ